MKKITVIGSGYVGLITALGLAQNNSNVIVMDIDEEKIKLLQNGKLPIYEPGAEELLVSSKNKIQFTTDIKIAVEESEILFICVPTPEKENGEVNLEYLYNAINNMIKHINKDKTIVIKSTVPVGTSDNIECYIYSKIKNKDLKIDIVSNPEFLSQGTAINDFINSQRIILGINSKYAEEKMKDIYMNFNAPILITDRKSSEMIKYASNCFLALKISYINEIANLCEKVGANIKSVEEGMGLDKRIGKYFLKAGIGYGGSCLPKDTNGLMHLAKENNIELKTVKAAIEVNKEQNLKLLEKSKIYYNTLNNKKVAILGGTFKKGTDDTRGAPAIINIDKLLEENPRISIYDPIGVNNIKNIYGEKIEYANTVNEAIKDADICLAFNELEELDNKFLDEIECNMKKPIFLDGRNNLEIENIKNQKVIYNSIGRRAIDRTKK